MPSFNQYVYANGQLIDGQSPLPEIGPSGRGIVSITQPNGAETTEAVVLYTDATQDILELPTAAAQVAPLSAITVGTTTEGGNGNNTTTTTFAEVAGAQGITHLYFENNTNINPSRIGNIQLGGRYFTAQSAAQNGNMSYVPNGPDTLALHQAMWYYSNRITGSNEPVEVGAGFYDCGLGSLIINPFMNMIYSDDAYMQSEGSFTGWNGFIETPTPGQYIKYNGGKIKGGVWQRKGSVANFRTMLPITNADDPYGAYIGDLTGILSLGTFQPDPANPFALGATTINLASLPTLNGLVVTLATLQAAWIGAAINAPYYFPTNTNITALAASAGPSPYVITLSNASIYPYPSISARAARAARFYTPASPARPSFAGFGDLNIQVLSSFAVYHSGPTFAIVGDNWEIDVCGRMWKGSDFVRLVGDNPEVTTHLACPAPLGGGTGFRYLGGKNAVALNCTGTAGDDYVNPVQGTNSTTSYPALPQYAALANLEIDNFQIQGGKLASLTARAIAVVASVNNAVQATLVPVTVQPGYNGIGNVGTIDIASFGTKVNLTSLQASSSLNPFYCGHFNEVAYASYVDGSRVTENLTDGTVSFGMLSETGAPYCILVPLKTNNNFTFQTGAPPYSLTCGTKVKAVGTICRSMCLPIVGCSNYDSQNIVELELVGVTIDANDVCDVGNVNSPAASLQAHGGAAGGVILRTSGGTSIPNPFARSILLNGNIVYASFDGMVCGQPLTNNGVVANVDLQGIQNGYLKGFVWSYAGVGTPSINLGGVSGYDEFGNPISNLTVNFLFDCLSVAGMHDGSASIQIDNVGTITFNNLMLSQASALGSGSAIGVTTTVNCSGVTILNGGNVSQIDNKLLGAINGSGPVYVTGSWEVNLASATTQIVCNYTPQEVLAQTANVVSVLATLGFSSTTLGGCSGLSTSQQFPSPSSNPPIPSFTTLEFVAELTATGTTSSSTITLPAPYSGLTGNARQTLKIPTAGTISQLNFAGAACNWTNGNQLKANTGLILVSSNHYGGWVVSSAS